MFAIVTSRPEAGFSMDCVSLCPNNPEMAIGASFVGSFLGTAFINLIVFNSWDLSSNLIGGGIGALAALVHSLVRPLLENFVFEPLGCDTFSKRVIEFVLVAGITTGIVMVGAPLLGLTIEVDLLDSAVITAIGTLRILASHDCSCDEAFGQFH